MAYGAFIVGGGAIPRIGDVIVTTVKTSPATRYKKTTWELVAQNRVPMGAGDGHEGGETVEAGLPNLIGAFYGRPHTSGSHTAGGALISADGKLFTYINQFDFANEDNGVAESATISRDDKVVFNASNYNPIYGASNTVQPPAYYFYFWRRVS